MNADQREPHKVCTDPDHKFMQLVVGDTADDMGPCRGCEAESLAPRPDITNVLADLNRRADDRDVPA